ncbi:hypothetical protein, partial [Hyalangium versicolor]|uniref:hypothetical protein n=1 Tax=Hyalangium versicolor TaxID=2861190 RepID=UPI001CCF9CEE
MTFYVSTSGNDSFECTSWARACATIQSAVDRVPKRLRHPVTINVSTGTFAAGAWLSGFLPDTPADASQGSYLIVSGSLTPATLASGSATGTLTAVSVGSGATWTTLTDSGQSWSAGALRGKFIEITSGAGAGIVKPISDNTATVLTLPGVVTGQAPTVGASYAIREVGTTINGMLSMA